MQQVNPQNKELVNNIIDKEKDRASKQDKSIGTNIHAVHKQYEQI